MSQRITTRPEPAWHAQAGLPPLTHQMTFRGTRADARQALGHYLAKLQHRSADLVSLVTAPEDDTAFAAQAHFESPAVGKIVLSVSAPANAAYAERTPTLQPSQSPTLRPALTPRPPGRCSASWTCCR